MIQALLDSCVILPMPLCDTLMRAAEKGYYRIHFSQKILNDASRNLAVKRNISVEKAERSKQFILKTFPEALIEPPAYLEKEVSNHPGDRHVLAAAIEAEADVIVTANLKHFPQESLDPWGIEVQHPDDFLSTLCEVHGDKLLYQLICEQAGDCKKPPQTELELLERLERSHPKFVRRLLAYKHRNEVERIAKDTLRKIGYNSPDCGRYYKGNFYDLSLTRNCLKIVDKVSGSEVMSVCNGTGPISLTVKDVLRFQKFDQELRQALAK